MILMAIGTCAFEAPVFKIIYDLFPNGLRCTVIATWGLTQCVVSAPSPAIAQWLSNYLPRQGGPICIWVSVMMSSMAVLYLVQNDRSKTCELTT